MICVNSIFVDGMVAFTQLDDMPLQINYLSHGRTTPKTIPPTNPLPSDISHAGTLCTPGLEKIKCQSKTDKADLTIMS